MKKLYPKTPDEKAELCSGFEPYTDKDCDFGVYNTDLKKFVVIQSKAEREQLEHEHGERRKNGILRSEYKPGEPPLTEEEIAFQNERTAEKDRRHTEQPAKQFNVDELDLDDISRPATEEEIIDAIARAELIDKIPDYESGWCLDHKAVNRHKGTIRTWLNANRNKEPFRKIYEEELAREQNKPDPSFTPMMKAIFRFRKEQGIKISEKTAGRYLKKDESRPRRNRL